MAKVGMPSFLLDTALDEKWELLEARYGVKGFAVVVKLFQRIYGINGYYCEWNEDISLLFARKIGVDCSLVSEIVSYALSLCLFDKELFDKSRILTSLSIQKTFLSFYKRREVVEVESSFLHSQISKTVYKNIKIVNKKDEIVCNSSEIVNQIKGNEIKGNEIKGNEINTGLIAYWESLTSATLSPRIIEKINNLSEFIDEDLIKSAMDITINKNIKNIEYVRSILVNWKKENIFTPADLYKRVNASSSIKRMVLPDYESYDSELSTEEKANLKSNLTAKLEKLKNNSR